MNTNIHSRKTSGQDLDLSAVRARLEGQTGPVFWRGLEELADTEEFRQFLHREFPENATELADPASRRTFLRVMGASLALAGVGLTAPGCDGLRSPDERILPYVRQPENIVPGRPLAYATAVTLGGYATGVLAETQTGRPIMLEGNPAHPDSLGAIDPPTQAALLGLYDPDRSQVILRRRGISTFEAFLLAAVNALDAQRGRKGAGVRILTETVTSPSLARQIRLFQKEHPGAKWHQYDPAGPHSARAGARLAFGRDAATQLRVDKADVILSLDADFLGAGPGHLRLGRQFSARRLPKDGAAMNRLYVVEPTVSITGSVADHRLRLRSSEVAALAQAVARKLGVPGLPDAPAPKAIAAAGRWVDALAADLQANKGKSLVVVGDGQPPYVHALAHAINQALGNVGQTVVYTEPVEAEPVDQIASIAELCRAMKAGQVDVLFVLGGNPAYDAPVDLGFAEGMSKVRFKARLGLYDDETSALCDWHIPAAHELEAWGDARASDGTATIQQPLIAPLYSGRSALELLAALLKDPDRNGYEIVRATWREQAPKAGDFDTTWQTALHEGIVADTAAKPLTVALKGDLGAAPTAPDDAATAAVEVIFRPDPTIYDGRFANNGWLQELPKPLTKLTWDNAALISPATAQRLRLGVSETEQAADVVELSLNGRKVTAPIWILPGQADGTVTLHLGYGRTRTGRVGTGAGFDAYALRTADSLAAVEGVEVRPLGRRVKLASTQMHGSLEGRDLFRVGTLAHYQKEPTFAQHTHAHDSPPGKMLYDDLPPDYTPAADDYQWAMVIDLNTCIGCHACTIACVAENNIPVIGREEVRRGRALHWLMIDRYFEGPDIDDPRVYHQPRTCMHCEKAPCELVCPVAATVHDHEGLNLMVYNRCVGTRYCSNNCPYKVRKFNFLQYADLRTPQQALLNNPDVSVRARGVMEKCTYCIQRINEVRYRAELEDRRIADGEIKTACQAACPTNTIVFGDLSNKDSAVSKLRASDRNYGMLAELNTRPRTTYLAKLRNPNPEIEAEKTEPSHA